MESITLEVEEAAVEMQPLQRGVTEEREEVVKVQMHLQLLMESLDLPILEVEVEAGQGGWA